MSRNHRWVYILFALLFVYGVFFILRASFTIDGKWYFSCADDVMITLDYARNVARGEGMRWFATGERVEGASSLLWVLVTGAIHWIVDSKQYTPGLVQLVSLLFLLLGLGALFRVSMVLTDDNRGLSIGIVALTFFYAPVLYWSVIGFEVSLAVALVLLMTEEVVRVCRGDAPRLWLQACLLALMVMLRNELGLFCLLSVALMHVHHWRDLFSKRVLLLSSVIFGISLGITTFRWLYFHEILPNTYYLKMTGYPLLLRMSRGVIVAFTFLNDLSLFLVALAGVGVFLLWRRTGWRVPIALSLPWALYLAYSVYVGGDAWEYRGGANRWLVPFMGSFFLLALYGGMDLFSRLEQHWGESVFSQRARRVVLLSCVWALLLVQVNLCGRNPLYSWTELLFLRKAMGVEKLKRDIKLGIVLARMTKTDAKIAVIVAGILPYHLEGRKFVDLYGYNDRVVAKLRAHVAGKGVKRYSSYMPGLVKWDLSYSVGTLKPDVIVRLPGLAKTAFLKDYASMYERVELVDKRLGVREKVWVRKGSRYIKYKRLVGCKVERRKRSNT
ncbi:MAG: hypothetical protein CL920_19560 [Deltaproteobacteria bacterium]|mgnify:CR=1 FL=1|nr:hypothetical protein [Deltaproteobacteria bacterium]MBU50886.1 hypothetical protein [Deltaproteobacteria bacterium]|tara:strand:+ start:6400 stop:8067 length:1668 start_codon:yes stop_codon:yes gene_type:complete